MTAPICVQQPQLNIIPLGPVQMVTTEYSIEEKIRDAFPEEPEKALAIATCESGLDPDVVNATDQHATCSGSYGIFQIGCIHSDNTEELLDADTNIAYARQLYDQYGWSPWSCNNLIAMR